MNAIIEALNDPLIYKWLQSILALFILLFIVLILRRILRKTQIKPEKRHQTLKWILYGILFVYLFILIRIWAGSGILIQFRNESVANLVKSGVALGALYLILYFVRRYINSIQLSITKKHLYRKRAGYTATIIYLILLIPIWAGRTQQWATMLSVMGAGIALALHEVLLNIAGWIYVLFKHPYRTGDRIELGDLQGDVIDIGVLQTTMLEIGNWVEGDQSTGRVVHMPHGQIFRQPLYNYTQGFEFIWNEFSILLTFESNWETAKAILLKFGEEESQEVQGIVRTKIDKMAREYLIYYKNFSPIVYTQIEESGVKLTLRYLTEARKRRRGINTLSEKVLKAIAEAKGIDFAYPTYRIFQRGEKGSSPSDQY
ncbi:mechanosensitive ion channel family protein [bacterium]